jgi:hypothetical protein
VTWMVPRLLAETEPTRKESYSDTDTTGSRDVRDAAQVPPSVFAVHAGKPEILHDDHQHNRARRHSVVSHQEKLSGV